MFIPQKDDKVRPTGGLGGLSHVDRKSPAPRPAPRDLVNGVGTPRPNPLNPRMNSPYADTNNTAPNFQTPTMQRPMAPNPQQDIQQLGAIETRRPTPSKKLGATPLFTMKNLGLFTILTAISAGGYYYTRNRSVEEYEADLAEDDY